MWEWSNRILKNNQPAVSKSLLAAYNDLLLPNTEQNTPTKVKDIDIADNYDENIQTPSPESMRSLLKSKLDSFGLSNMILRECFYEPQNWSEMDNSFIEYQRIREVFLKLLGYSYAKDCLDAGLSQKDIKLLRQNLAPENYNTHMKIPFDFGGTLDFDNLCLIKTYPVHDMIHRLIDMQIENNFLRIHKKIFLPYFEGRIYHD